jgi:4-hydroxybenzoate polyprenyltransferase
MFSNFKLRIALFWRLIRAPQWWNYKIPLALAAAFAFASSCRIAYKFIWLPVTLIVISGLLSAAYASLVNDYTDLEQDRLGGKHTTIMELSKFRRAVALGVMVFANICMCFFLHNLRFSCTIYCVLLVIFTIYSVPPIRLKEQGLIGVLCISLGEHVLPALLATMLVAECSGCKVSTVWLAAVICWSAAFGLRGILWHQLSDLDNDLIANCSTLAVRIGSKTIERVGMWIVFPLECVGLLGMLILTNNPTVWLGLVLYGILDYLRARYMFANVIIVSPRKNARFLFFEYYQLLLTLCLLLSAVPSDPSAVILVAMFMGMFAAPIAQALHEIIHLIKSDLYQAAKRILAGGGHA